MREFLTRLLSNPNFAGQPASVIEALIINFIDKNASGLAPAFKSPEYFPDKSWDETRVLLVDELRNMVLEEIKPRVRNLVNANIDFSMLNLLDTAKGHDSDTYLEEAWNFYEKVLHIADVRMNLDAFGRLIESKMIDTYVMTAGSNRSYTYTELFKVDRIRIKTEEYLEALKVMFFLRPFIYIPVPVDPGNVKRGVMTLAEVKRSPTQLKQFCENLKQMLLSSLPSYPSSVIDSLIDSCQDWEENPNLSASGRFINILSTRARDLRLNQKVSKGAETPDKSWFSISIRNARYLGHDKRMLEDLNAMAFELRK